MYNSKEYAENLDILKEQMNEETAAKYADIAEEILQMYVEFLNTNQKYMEGSLFYYRMNQKLYDKHYIWIENINYYLETGLKLFPIEFNNPISEFEADYFGSETDDRMLQTNYSIYLDKIFDIETKLADWIHNFNRKYKTKFSPGNVRVLLEKQKHNYERSINYTDKYDDQDD